MSWPELVGAYLGGFASCALAVAGLARWAARHPELLIRRAARSAERRRAKAAAGR